MDTYSKKKIKEVIIKAISGMCSFLITEKVARKIVNEYGKIFGLKKDLIEYYNNLLFVQWNKNYLFNKKKLSLKGKESKDKALILILSSATVFLNKKEYINIFKLCKNLYNELKKYI